MDTRNRQRGPDHKTEAMSDADVRTGMNAATLRQAVADPLQVGNLPRSAPFLALADYAAYVAVAAACDEVWNVRPATLKIW